jgi:hypothetical protein
LEKVLELIEMEETNLTVKIKFEPEMISVQVPSSGTVLNLKEACQGKTGVSTENIKLIFKGRILKDEKTLEESKITESGLIVTMHNHDQKKANEASAAPASAAPASAAGPGGLGGLGGLGGVGGGMGGLEGLLAGMGGAGGAGGEGGMASMFDPAFMQQMMSNPMVAEMMEKVIDKSYELGEGRSFKYQLDAC